MLVSQRAMCMRFLCHRSNESRCLIGKITHPPREIVHISEKGPQESGPQTVGGRNLRLK